MLGFFKRKRHRREDMEMVRRAVETPNSHHWSRTPSWFWRVAALFLLTLVLVVVCFWGRPPHLPVLLPGSIAHTRYEAAFDFSYISKHKSQLRMEEARRKVTPICRIATEKSDPILAHYRKMIDDAGAQFDTLKTMENSRQEMDAACLKILADSEIPGIWERLCGDLAFIVFSQKNGTDFRRLLDESYGILATILKNGIYDDTAETLIHSANSTDRKAAIRNLNDNLDIVVANGTGAIYAPEKLVRSLSNLFRPGLVQNLELDEKATQERREAAVKNISPIRVFINVGDTIIEPGEHIDADDMDKWHAYNQEWHLRAHSSYGLTKAFFENIFIALFGVILIGFFTKIIPSKVSWRRREISLTALLILLNLTAIRLLLTASESVAVREFLGGGDWLFWLAPPAFAAIVLSVLVGPYMALLASLFVSIFSTMMLNRNIDVLLITFFANLIGIYCSKGAHNRNKVLGAGIMSGVAVAALVFLLCFFSELGWQEIAMQIVLCLASGFLTGVFAVGLVPVLEGFFKITTDITLLELTDYNLKLLAKLQLAAPGTFHHSVMVANLAERAASEIGANALLCRCASLYHDVGKIPKPEYFTENQIAGVNPHALITPAMSALVIKSHVREGAEIAREYKLPQVIIDIIEQHHGTGLISFFYNKAKEQNGTASPDKNDTSAMNADKHGAPAYNSTEVDEKTFRYDGPRPRTKEAAIVMLADGVEAAAVSLKSSTKKVTPTAIEDLVDRIVNSRIADYQLEQSPLTFRELQRIRAALKYYLQNMYHSRPEYPNDTAAETPRKMEADATD